VQLIISILENPESESLKGRQGAVTTILASETLKPYQNGSLWLETLEPTYQNARILKAEFVAALCEYYAFEKNNETAKFSYRKFAKMGIDSWIRDVTGHAQPVAIALTSEQLTMQLLQVTQQALESEHKLRITTERLLEKEQYITRATINSPGLNQFLEGAQDEDLAESEVTGPLTLAEWLHQVKQVSIPDKMYRQLRLRVAEFFKTLHHYKPKKELRYTKAGHPAMTYVYGQEDFHFLDTVFTQVFASYRA
jgi:hypothetical protein